MNRAFLIVIVPAILVAAGYLAVTSYLGLRLNFTRFLVAGGGFFAAVVIVRLYQRRKSRSSGG
jgi:ABC-type spermidine/putrescine transport system permease subunit II